MTQTERLLHEALSLSEPERADLAARLLESLHGQTDSDVDEAWSQEIERRCASLDSGETVSSDWNVVRLRIERAILGR
jgi:putative addiction module component (TIGR02574 family)